jgi:hypothetical protein
MFKIAQQKTKPGLLAAYDMNAITAAKFRNSEHDQNFRFSKIFSSGWNFCTFGVFSPSGALVCLIGIRAPQEENNLA